MSIRTTVNLDEDVLERVKHESRLRGASFRDTLNELLRFSLMHRGKKPRRPEFQIFPVHMGYRESLNYDNVEALLEYGEGQQHL